MGTDNLGRGSILEWMCLYFADPGAFLKVKNINMEKAKMSIFCQKTSYKTIFNHMAVKTYIL